MTAQGFALSEEHRMVRATVEELLHRLRPQREAYFQAIFDEMNFPGELWDRMAEIGLFGALVPEEYGGTGMGLLPMTIALEAFAGEGLGNTMAMVTAMDTMAIVRAGTPEQKRRWLPDIAAGKLCLAFAITEPDAGTNSFRISTLARRDGDGYRLSGQKAWITGVDRSQAMLVVARTIPYEEVVARGLPPRHGLSLFMVDTQAPGLTVQPMDTVGIEGFRQFFVFFDEVPVPERDRIGPEHEGLAALFDALNAERILTAALCLGMTEFALRQAAEYARERRVFGDTPIGAYQAVQHPLARLKVLQEAARLLTYQAATAFDQGEPSRQVGLQAAMAKYLASEIAFEALDRAIQTHGGNGFVKGYHLIQMLAPARLFKTAPINNEMLLNYIAEHALGLPRSY